MGKKDLTKAAGMEHQGRQAAGPQPGLFPRSCVPSFLNRAGAGRSKGPQNGSSPLFSDVPELAWVKDREGRFISASAAFAGACGLGHRELIGKTDWELWPRKLAARYARRDEKVLGTGLPDRAVSAAADGGGRRTEVIRAPLFGRDGRMLGTLGIARDISAHERAAGQLRQVARKVIRAREDEKKRISNFLHDELGSLIMLLNSSLALARQEALKGGPAAAAARIEEAKKTAHGLAGALRRLCFDIRPPAMGVSGLAGAVAELADRTERCTEVKVRCDLRLPGEKKLDGLVKIMAYRIVQEALNNAVKHSGARSVKIALRCAGGKLKFSVSDDGKGFDADAAGARDRHPTLGLSIMREEAESMCAALSVESAPGFGTVVKGEFPPGPAQGGE